MKTTPFYILLLFAGNLLLAQSDRDKVLETVHENTIKGHIYFLADDLLKGRETGTPENKIAASYLANAFRKYGVQPNPLSGNYYQEVKLERTYPANSMSLSVGDLEIEKTAGLRVGNMAYDG